MLKMTPAGVTAALLIQAPRPRVEIDRPAGLAQPTVAYSHPSNLRRAV
jgi:hypothetical protein